MQQLNKFKKIEFEEIPKEWSYKKIGELLDEKIILGLQDGNHGELHPKLIDFIEKGIPFLTANCITNNRISFDKCKYLSDRWLKKLRIGFARENDIILTHKGTLGLCAIVPSGIKNIILSPQTTYYRLSPKICSIFLFYFFQSKIFQNQLFSLGRQSTRDYVGINSQKSLNIVLPLLSEQQKIASILSNIDELIQKTEQIIETSQKFKRGLMQRLLTKGIGHIKFKKVKWHYGKILEIPYEWELINISQILLKIKRGPSLSTNVKEDGVIYLTSDYITDEGILKFNNLKFLSLKLIDGIDKYIINKSNVILNCVNSLEQIGKVAIFEGYPKEVIVGFNNFALELKSIIDPHYIKYFFLSELSQYFFKSLSKPAVHQVSFSSKDLLKMDIPFPPFKEQQKIASILSNIDELIQFKKSVNNNLKHIKKSLMQQLLTGKIRVKINR